MRPSKLVCLVAVALAGCASQQEPVPAASGQTRTLQDLNGSQVATPIGLFLTSLDVDRDALISQNEVERGISEAFRASDANNNGSLSPIEFTDWSATYLGSEYTNPSRLHFDQDQDSGISEQEFELTFAGIYNRLDKDKSGTLNRGELLVQISGTGLDPLALRAQMESEMRSKMQQMCRQGGRGSM